MENENVEVNIFSSNNNNNNKAKDDCRLCVYFLGAMFLFKSEKND